MVPKSKEEKNDRITWKPGELKFIPPEENKKQKEKDKKK